MEFVKEKFVHGDIEIDVNVLIEDASVWLSKEQMAALFKKDRSVISRHIKKILIDNPIEEKSNVHYLHIANSDKPVLFYNLEIIQIVGQKTKSDIITVFNNWCIQTINKLRKDLNTIVYNNGDININVKVEPEEETVWLNVNQIALLFETTTENIYQHIKKIYEDGELIDSVVKNFLVTEKEIMWDSSDGKTYLTTFYCLDMILAIGYRVKSKKAIIFRRWANRILKEFLLRGYVINEERTLITTENYYRLVNKVDKLEERIEKIEEKEKYSFIENKIIYENTVYESLSFISNIVETANSSIVLIDPYVEVRTLSAFKNKKDNVSLVFITSNKMKLSKIEIDDFNNAFCNLSISIDDRYHDRYLVIDDLFFYHLGSSINHLGKRFSQVTLINEEDIINVLKQRIVAISKNTD